MIRQIKTLNNTATLVITSDILEQLGLTIGDEVEITIVDQTLILRSLAEAAREKRIKEHTESLLEKRQHVYAVLAAGSSRGDYQ